MLPVAPQAVGPVARGFGVRLLADDGDRRLVCAVTAVAVAIVGDRRVGRDGAADALEDRGARSCRPRGPLPPDRPATALHADVVRALAGHEDLARRLGQWKRPV